MKHAAYLNPPSLNVPAATQVVIPGKSDRPVILIRAASINLLTSLNLLE